MKTNIVTVVTILYLLMRIEINIYIIIGFLRLHWLQVYKSISYKVTIRLHRGYNTHTTLH